MLRSLLIATLALGALASAAPPLDLAEEVAMEGTVSCKANTYYWGVWQTKHYCVACKSGTVSQGCTDCAPDPDAKACRAAFSCKAGSFIDTVSHACSKCPAGQFSLAADVTSCESCAVGKYQPLEGLTGCYACAKGHYSAKLAATGCAKCDSCAAGTFGSTAATGATDSSACTCAACDAGRYTPKGYTKCFDCPAGRFQANKQAYSCYFCSTGKYSGAGQTACETCADGQTTAGRGQSTCALTETYYTAHFRGYDYQAGAKFANWNLMTAKDLGLYGRLFIQYYKMGKSLYLLRDFKSDSCCLSIADGHRIEADGTSFVYPSKDGSSLQCGAGSLYKSDKTLKLLTTGADGKNVDFGSATSLRAGVGSDLCARKAGETNPGVYFSLAPGATDRTHCENFEGNVKVCLPSAAYFTRLALSEKGETMPPTPAPVTTTAAPVTTTTTTTTTPPPTPWVKPSAEDCIMKQWGAWKDCSRTCGTGFQTRARAPLRQDKWGGAPCPSFSESRMCNTVTCPVDCLPGPWQEWSACSKTCGSGSQYRERSIARAAISNGKACSPLKEQRKCADQACPVDCTMSAWSSFAACSVTCGQGERVRTRGFVSAATNGGKACGPKEDSELCAHAPCNADCKVTAWGPWSGCTKSCGSGYHERKRAIVQVANGGGATCPPIVEGAVCKAGPCPIDCVHSKYGAFGACSKKCGGGSQTAFRSITVNSAFGGKACNVLSKAQACNTASCPQDCIVSDFGLWSKCSKDCNNGVQVRRRSIVEGVARGGAACPHQSEERKCNSHSCPVDCVLHPWPVAWTTCSKVCGGGYQTKSRTILTDALFGGLKCDARDFSQYQVCNTQPCAIDCKLSTWDAWSVCSVTCGTGYQYATRAITVAPLNGGKACGQVKRNQVCTKAACPVDCRMTEWSEWSACTKTCGRGTTMRKRNMVSAPSNGGAACPHDRQAQTCFLGGCPAKCVMSAWGSWSPCSKKCGTGKRSHTRTALAGPCQTAATVFEETCNTQACPVDCAYSSWSWTGTCTHLCGGGKRTRTRTITAQADHGGKACTALSDVTECNTQACPVDCIVTEWTKYTRCSRSCGGGEHKRMRSVSRVSENGGKPCPTELAESSACQTQACPSDCTMSSWGAWGACPVTCGKGEQVSTRNIVRVALNGGKTCGATLRKQDCRDASCPVACAEGVWSAWTQCSKTCGGGATRRQRTQVQPRFGGAACGASAQSKSCNPAACPTACKVSSWNAYGSCSTSCGAGRKMRTRNVEIKNSPDGTACPALTDYAVCSGAPCPVDCLMQNWEAWTSCSVTCGAGSKSRTRKIFTKAANGGKACGLTTATADCAAGPCPINCQVSGWSAWSPCSAKCGGGASTRERSVATHATLDGYTCPHLTERKACNTEFCPVDCVVGTWESWTLCTKTCGGGSQKRVRHPIHAAAFGGKACEHVNEMKSCNSQACPVDCIMPAFSGPWSTCTKACGTGSQKRYREPTTRAANGGSPCKLFIQERPCSVKPCAIDCVLSAWESSQCSAACGTGHITKKRTVITAAAFGGKKCGALLSNVECNTQPCAINCVQTTFSDWSGCTATCGGGVVTRTRRTVQQGAFGGQACPDNVETKPCGTGACPVNCVMSGWSVFDACTRSCGKGTQSRTRRIVTGSAFGGATCGKVEDIKSCNVLPCPVDCVLADFGTWGACSTTCGGGKRIRFRSVETAPEYTGKACAELKQVGDCNTFACPIDCKISVWSAWSACSTTCALGYKTALRTIISDPRFGGKSCDAVSGGRYSRRADCNADSPCPIHCTISPWGAWSACPVTCGGSVQFRNRGIVIKAQHGGVCPSLKEQQSCGTDSCAVDCKLNLWGSWGKCSKSCNGGQRQRSRSIQVVPVHGGKTCGSLTATQSCNTFFCPVNCVVSSWQSWSACTVSCGTGTTSRSKRIQTSAAYGGKVCPSTNESKNCATEACPVDCVQSAWINWGACTEKCAGGTATRTRSTDRAAEHGGKACGVSSQTRTCNTQLCPVNCVLTSWMKEGSCTRSCGRGVQKLMRYVQKPALYGGLECSSNREMANECNSQACPIDCAFTWGGWSSCTKACGGGISSRTQQRTVLPAFGGKACGANTETKACNQQNCAIDCLMGAWTGWSDCSLTCGGGLNKRTRPIAVQSAFGGKTCDSGEQVQSCNVDACPVDCVVGAWTTFSKCSVSCGPTGGIKTRTRTNVKAQMGGVACPTKNVEVESCNKTPCPVHCQVGGWSLWTACTKTCGGGTQVRSRSVIERAAHGGFVCPSLDESRSCKAAACPVDCTMSAWGSYSACSVTCGGNMNIDVKGKTGGGRQTRSRSMTSPAKFGGANCGVTTETKGFCNTQECPVDCVVSQWSEFSACTNTCGEATKTRSRQRTREALFGGAKCATPLIETVRCQGLPVCPVDCALTQWTSWTTCTKTCDGGKQARTRDVITPANKFGAACGPQADAQDCSTQSCPDNCILADTWNAWGDCSVTCGGGVQTRSKNVVRQAKHGGTACGPTSSSQVCGATNCPIDCKMTAWSAWSQCTKTCAGGSRSRSRSVSVEAYFGGVACGHKAESDPCNMSNCPVDCQTTNWSGWTSCTKTCGSGNQQRTKQIVSGTANGGKACPSTIESRACNVVNCPIDCVEKGWGLWTPCTKTCGGGNRKRTNPIVLNAQHGGNACPWQREQTEECNTRPCPVDCNQSAFSSWSECTKNCGSGSQERSRTTFVETRHGGKSCGIKNESRVCNDHPCPIHCKVGAFSDWGACSVPCGQGSMKKIRKALVWPAHGGKECPALSLNAICEQPPCGINCKMSAWGAWKQCSKSCGGGKRSRIRVVVQEAASKGSQCPSLAETVPCNTDACPADCKVSGWSAWTKCTSACGGGRKSRTRTVLAAPDAYGVQCPPRSAVQSCNSHACAVDCQMSSWTQWGACSKSCGVSYKFQQRQIERVSEYGGKRCGSLIASKKCDVPACPLDCQLEGRGTWGVCSERCGGGVQTRALFVKQYPVGTGMACPPRNLAGAWTDKQACNTQACPIERIEDHFQFLDRCSHITCKYHKTHSTKTTLAKTVKVLHHRKEQKGDRHVCKQMGGSCVCKCFDKNVSLKSIKAKAAKIVKKLQA